MLPKVPPGHTLQVARPPVENVPGWQMEAIALVEPAAQANPGAQAPVQFADVCPVVLPNRPAEHVVQTEAAMKEYVPSPHTVPVADPAGQANPAGHSPVHADELRPAVLPKRPGAHKLHTVAPAMEYVPGPQMEAEALVLPAGQMKPAGHGPLQLADTSPGVLPNTPPGHTVHTAAPPVEYVPGWHRVAVALVLPAGQAYPAAQAPVQVDTVSPRTPPNRPAGHSEVQLGDARPVVLPNRPRGHAVHTTADPVE